MWCPAFRDVLGEEFVPKRVDLVSRIRDANIAFERRLAVRAEIAEVDHVRREIVRLGLLVRFPHHELAHHRRAFQHLRVNLALQRRTRRQVQLTGVAIHQWHLDEIGNLLDANVARVKLLVIASSHELRRDQRHQRQPPHDLVLLLDGVPVERHLVHRRAARRVRNHIEHADLDDDLRAHHVVRDLVVDFDVFARRHRVFEVAEERTAIVLGEAATDVPEHVQEAILPHHRQQQIVDHPVAIVDAFGEADDHGIERVPGLHFEHAGTIAAGNQPLGPGVHPRLELLGDVAAVLDPVRLRQHDSRAAFEERFEPCPRVAEHGRRCGPVDFDDVERREVQVVEFGFRCRLPGDAAHVVDAPALAIGPREIEFPREECFLDPRRFQLVRRFFFERQPDANGATRIDENRIAVFVSQHAELAVDFQRHVVVGRRQAFGHIGGFERNHPRCRVPLVVLRAREERRIDERRGGANGIACELDFEFVFANETHDVLDSYVSLPRVSGATLACCVAMRSVKDTFSKRSNPSTLRLQREPLN